MLTASSSDAARAAGFQLGASDYVTKPFGFADLVDRVRALAP
jgi:DNA-binding response OmpR family regulator